MRRLMRTQTTGWMLVGFLISCPLFAETVATLPTQMVPAGTVRPAADNGSRPKPDRTPAGTSQVMARNTVSKTETPPAKEQKPNDKKTIGRCWQRLINTFREINHAHRSRTN